MVTSWKYTPIDLPADRGHPKHFRWISVREKVARVTGLEPAASGVTGRRSNQLSYTRAMRSARLQTNRSNPFPGRMARVTGLEPAASGVTGRRSNQLSYTRLKRRRSYALGRALSSTTACEFVLKRHGHAGHFPAPDIHRTASRESAGKAAYPPAPANASHQPPPTHPPAAYPGA